MLKYLVGSVLALVVVIFVGASMYFDRWTYVPLENPFVLMQRVNKYTDQTCGLLAQTGEWACFYPKSQE